MQVGKYRQISPILRLGTENRRCTGCIYTVRIYSQSLRGELRCHFWTCRITTVDVIAKLKRVRNRRPIIAIIGGQTTLKASDWWTDHSLDPTRVFIS